MNSQKIFTMEEVEKLVKNAYDVGYCDGIDSIEADETNYVDSNDFWAKNISDWSTKEILYII